MYIPKEPECIVKNRSGLNSCTDFDIICVSFSENGLLPEHIWKESLSGDTYSHAMSQFLFKSTLFSFTLKQNSPSSTLLLDAGFALYIILSLKFFNINLDCSVFLFNIFLIKYIDNSEETNSLACSPDNIYYLYL